VPKAGLANQPRLIFAANLDILRTLAVSLVLVAHVMTQIRFMHGIVLGGYDDVGALGVLLFFVHTALVLSFSLERLGTGGWVLMRTFLLRRAFRLYPLSIACVLLVVACRVPEDPFEHIAAHHSWGELLSNLALTMNLTNTSQVIAPL
jgi:peptidoglycan/LPS O-acetylase OafA/YrhL